MNMVDEVLLALKLVGILLSAVCGLLALATNSKDTSTNRLTRAGWVYSGLIGVGMVLALVAQVVDSRLAAVESNREVAVEAKQIDDTNRLLSRANDELTATRRELANSGAIIKTAETIQNRTLNIARQSSESLTLSQGNERLTSSVLGNTSRVLKNTERILDPIRDLRVTYSLQLPDDNPQVIELKSQIGAAVRRQDFIAPFKSGGTLEITSWSDAGISVVTVPDRGALFPEPASPLGAFTRSACCFLALDLYASSPPRSSPDATYSFTSSATDTESSVDLDYLLSTKELVLDVDASPSAPSYNVTGRLSSVLDLAGAKVVATLSTIDQGNWPIPLAEAVSDLGAGTRLATFELSVSGRSYDLTGSIRKMPNTQVSPFAETQYSLQFPPNLENSGRAQL